jgi:hypothetical protein
MPSPDHDPPATPAFGLIIIGDEILSGKRTDKHMPKVIELLGARGLALSWAEYVGIRRSGSPQRCGGLCIGRCGVLHRRDWRHAGRPHPPMCAAGTGVPLACIRRPRR